MTEQTPPHRNQIITPHTWTKNKSLWLAASVFFYTPLSIWLIKLLLDLSTQNHLLGAYLFFIATIPGCAILIVFGGILWSLALQAAVQQSKLKTQSPVLILVISALCGLAVVTYLWPKQMLGYPRQRVESLGNFEFSAKENKIDDYMPFDLREENSLSKKRILNSTSTWQLTWKGQLLDLCKSHKKEETCENFFITALSKSPARLVLLERSKSQGDLYWLATDANTHLNVIELTKFTPEKTINFCLSAISDPTNLKTNFFIVENRFLLDRKNFTALPICSVFRNYREAYQENFLDMSPDRHWVTFEENTDAGHNLRVADLKSGNLFHQYYRLDVLTAETKAKKTCCYGYPPDVLRTAYRWTDSGIVAQPGFRLIDLQPPTTSKQ